MNKEEFLGLEIKDQIEHINQRTKEGLKVSEVAQELGMGDKTLRNRIKKAGYVFSRPDSIYIYLGEEGGNNEGITGNNKSVSSNKKVIRNKKVITQEEPQGNNEGITKEEARPEEEKKCFSDEELKGLKELLEVKEQLFLIAGITQDKGITSNNKGITIFDTINLNKSNRKKATFNMDLDLLEILNIYEKESDISKSDVVNVALMEYFKARGIKKK